MSGKKSRADANVMRLVQKEMRLKAAQDNVRDQAVAEARAQWTTKWAASSNSQARKRVEDACYEELAMENENIKRVRQHELRKLYEAEWQQWKEELNKRGLAIADDD